ncbi:MAG: hypothetical protein E6I37_00980 [Chloroflexi bacterium]|nr:MAG: hypothetical protein E6I37_00980 [Chloroflexota bacterium]
MSNLLGDQANWKPPIAALIMALVLVAGTTIFGIRQDAKGMTGIGWLGALLTAVTAVLALFVAIALNGDWH